MIVEQKKEPASEPESVSSPVDQKKPVRSAAAAAWDAQHTRSISKTGLEKPERAAQPNAPAESMSQVNQDNPHAFTPEKAATALAEGRPVPNAEARTPRAAAEQKSLVKSSSALPRESPSGFQRVVQIARVVGPVVQRLLPLLDGNVATAVANVIAQRHGAGHSAPIDMEPIEDALNQLKAGHAQLEDRILAQRTSIEKIAAQATRLEQAADALAANHADLESEVGTLRRRITTLTRIAVVLLVLLVATDAYLVLHLLHIAP